MYINYGCVEPRLRLFIYFSFWKSSSLNTSGLKAYVSYSIYSNKTEQALDSGTGEWGRELELPLPPSPLPWVNSELTGFTYMLDLPGAVRENFGSVGQLVHT